MRGYKTSKDYKRLKELLDAGREVVIAYPDIFFPGRCEAYLAKKTEDPICHKECYDFGIGLWYESSHAPIEERLKRLGIEFIEPTEE